ncbi:hypothetical protein GVO57_08060 [Sphingomonas changnyeongensis]|uniref:Uncharacterized protein n=1 Tax=Sphingomonas changnyeongensis TaxID=2698679 RepID=A0A7Z2S8M7_9SPHN|nr:hypothetical protein [Sphingomonas changnyeongensis]QHL90792.1 hypothetical protein GVO57_08060 [Sphingomonas changnyeongensis]
MFVDFRGDPPPASWPPPRGPLPGPRITRPRERRLMALVALNLILLLVAPIGGATLIVLLFG